MSRLRTNIITNRMANGAPTVSNGLVISGVTTTSQILVGNSIKLDPVSGISTFTEIKLDDNNKLNFGDSSDLQLWHNGSHSNIKNSTGRLYILANDIWIKDGDDGDFHARFLHDDASELYFDGGKKLETTNTGVTVTGTVAATAFTGDGSGLTGTGVGGNSSINTTGIITATAFVSNQPSSHKNYIMNGKAMIFQRYLPGSMVTVNAGSNFYCMDRWYGRGEGSKGVFTFHQHDIQSQGQAAHAALRVNVTTTSTPSTNDVYKVAQRIEGRNIDGLGFGTSGAKTITLSFLTKSSVTGTHGGSIMNGAQNRAYPFTYTINSADTWEQKSITIPGDTSGTWSSGNDVGLEVNFDMGTAESNYRRPAGSWYAGRAEGADGTVQLITQSGGNWYATKIQLEEGNVATPFEHIPYPDELLRCKRYSFILGGGDTETYTTLLMGIQSHSNLCKAHVQFPVDMRSKDVTFSFSDLTLDDDIASYSDGRVNSVNSENAGKSSATLIFNTASMSNVNATRILTDATGGYIFCDCEL